MQDPKPKIVKPTQIISFLPTKPPDFCVSWYSSGLRCGVVNCPRLEMRNPLKSGNQT